jgi:hypothetical protein
MSEENLTFIECDRCGTKFSYVRGVGRPRKLCDTCREVHAPRNWTTPYVPHNDIHVHLSDEDREKLQFIIENYGTNRIEAIRTSIRIVHAILLSDMSRR